MPASEALLDAEAIKRFRSRYREEFGATATQDPLYQALSSGRRMAGMEHWLPLLEERLETLFDHLAEDDLIVRDANADQALDARRDAIEDYYSNRVRAMASEGRVGRICGGSPDPLRVALPRARIRSDHRFRSGGCARLRAGARPAGQCL
jgi:transcription-repair coupling factor (superfamily II helicase)